MRTRILTNYERKMLQQFLLNGTKMEGFKVLVHRSRKYLEALKEDVDLISKALQKLKTET